MADYLNFTAGDDLILADGLPSTCFLALSSKPCSGSGCHVVGDTLAGGIGEIGGTGYGRQSQAAPTPSGGEAVFTVVDFATGTATDWPSSVKSVVLVSSADNSGTAIAAFNLIAGGAARNLSQAQITEQVTVTLSAG
jgi:hypothetical protein